MLNPTDGETTGAVVRFPTGEHWTTLTPRGDALVALLRFERALKALDGDDRDAVMEALGVVMLEACRG